MRRLERERNANFVGEPIGPEHVIDTAVDREIIARGGTGCSFRKVDRGDTFGHDDPAADTELEGVEIEDIRNSETSAYLWRAPAP